MSFFDRLRRFFGGSPPSGGMYGGSEETPQGSDPPPSDRPPAGVRERRGKPRPPIHPSTRILIIDDSATIVATLRKMLRQNGFATYEAGDAEKGLEVAQAEVPDVIFLDIVLPGMNGFSALRQLRRDPRTNHIPVIMISGNAQATEEFYVQRIGADDFMKKPFSRPEIFARIERLLDEEGRPRRLTELARLKALRDEQDDEDEDDGDLPPQ